MLIGGGLHPVLVCSNHRAIAKYLVQLLVLASSLHSGDFNGSSTRCSSTTDDATANIADGRSLKPGTKRSKRHGMHVTTFSIFPRSGQPPVAVDLLWANQPRLVLHAWASRTQPPFSLTTASFPDFRHRRNMAPCKSRPTRYEQRWPGLPIRLW